MIMIIKKKNLVLIFTVFLLFLMCLKLFLYSLPTSALPGADDGKLRIVIDPGHGGTDGGAVGAGGIKEEALNLDVSLYLEELLSNYGACVIMTRKDHGDLQSSSSKTVRQKKVSDIHNREKIMNDSKADLFISIHMNKFTDSRYSGPQVFYSATRPESKLLAHNVQKSMIETLKPVQEREIKEAGGNIYLMKKARLPAVLIECGFLSNADETALLKTEEYKKKLAQAIFDGITKYLEANDTAEKKQ